MVFIFLAYFTLYNGLQFHGSNLDAHQQTNGQGSCGTYIYTTEYYSAIKKNAFESVLMRWTLFVCLAALGLSCSLQDVLLRHTDSLVLACWLSCSVACGILVPEQGWNLCLLHCKAES